MVCVCVCSSMSVGGVSFPLEQQSRDPQSAIYSGLYNTEGVAHTKSGERQPVQINVEVRLSRFHLLSETHLAAGDLPTARSRFGRLVQMSILF